MRNTTYQDADGRKFIVQLPDGAPDDHAQYGVLVGPPPLDKLGLPMEVEVALNNQLYDRHLLTRADVNRRKQDVLTAWQSVLKVDVGRIVDMYTLAHQDEGG